MSEDLEITLIDARREEIEPRLAALREKLSPRGDLVSEAGRKRTIETFGAPLTPQQVVEKICHDVRTDGLTSLLDYSRRLDRAELTSETLRVSEAEISAAHAQAAPEFLAAVRKIHANIREFQSAILHRDVTVKRPGVTLTQKYVPLERVGCCVPGGAAAYPSTVLMTAGVAAAAGVKEIVVVAPPTPFGANNPDVLAVCRELGVSEVYRMGGAQAVAALAYGVEGIRKVDKIVGPGSLFVTLAKKHVYGEVDIDSLAGPSEVVVIADRTARPDFIASDMLAQAEHSPGSAVLVTWDETIAHAVRAELGRQAALLSRCELTLQSLREFGAIVIVRDDAEACRVANSLAPEHLHVATDAPERFTDRLPHAGALFLGHYSPVALGDYAAGPSHVLPTGGTARWAAGLTANSFLRGGSVIHYSDSALAEIAPCVKLLAEKEGLTAHRASVEIRGV